MMRDDDLDDAEERVLGLYLGQVVAVDDPDRIGRVKVKVPGLLEGEGSWAMPIGAPGGGHTDRGFFAVPPVGATVGVMFVQGDIDDPVYLCGPWGYVGGKTDIPVRRVSSTSMDSGAPAFDPDAASPTDIALRQAFATDKWGIYFDDKDELLLLRHKTKEVGVSISGRDRTVVVFGTTTVQLRSEGMIDIDAARVQIQGRIVTPNRRPI
jgi:hypothetical protein